MSIIKCRCTSCRPSPEPNPPLNVAFPIQPFTKLLKTSNIIHLHRWRGWGKDTLYLLQAHWLEKTEWCLAWTGVRKCRELSDISLPSASTLWDFGLVPGNPSHSITLSEVWNDASAVTAVSLRGLPVEHLPQDLDYWAFTCFLISHLEFFLVRLFYSPFPQFFLLKISKF